MSAVSPSYIGSNCWSILNVNNTSWNYRRPILAQERLLSHSLTFYLTRVSKDRTNEYGCQVTSLKLSRDCLWQCYLFSDVDRAAITGSSHRSALHSSLGRLTGAATLTLMVAI